MKNQNLDGGAAVLDLPEEKRGEEKLNPEDGGFQSFENINGAEKEITASAERALAAVGEEADAARGEVGAGEESGEIDDLAGGAKTEITGVQNEALGKLNGLDNNGATEEISRVTKETEDALRAAGVEAGESKNEAAAFVGEIQKMPLKDKTHPI